MKRFFKVLAAAWLTGLVIGAGCFCGAIATGMIVNDGPDARLIAAQIVELQETLEAIQLPGVYDAIAVNPIDEFAGLE